MTRSLALLVSTVALGSCSGAPNHVPESPPRDVLVEVLQRAGFRSTIVLDSTIPIPSMARLEVFMESTWVDSARHQIDEALAALQLNSSFRWSIDHRLIQTIGAEPVAQKPAYTSTLDPPGPSVVSVSAVGVSSDSTVMMLYWEYHCGPLCAGGTVSFFRRGPDSHWLPWHNQPLWRS
jgi:hypothetical protein